MTCNKGSQFKFCKTELSRPESCPLFWHVTCNKWQNVCHVPPLCLSAPNNGCLLLLTPWKQLSFLRRRKRWAFWSSIFLFQPLLTVGLQKYSMLSSIWQTPYVKQNYKFWLPTEMRNQKKHFLVTDIFHLGTHRKNKDNEKLDLVNVSTYAERVKQSEVSHGKCKT